MRTLGNIIWFMAAGFWSWLVWVSTGLLLCITVIGIPFGIQCFKIANFGLFPFGKVITPSNRVSSFLWNIIWILLFGWELFMIHIITAFILCITIIGIPFANQSFKLAMLSLFPFGVTIKKL